MPPTVPLSLTLFPAPTPSPSPLTRPENNTPLPPSPSPRPPPQVTKGGRVETLHALVVVGNADGLIGVGQHSGKNVQKVTMDAQLKAYRNLLPIPRYRSAHAAV